MVQDSPTFALVNFAIAAYLSYMWFCDFDFFRKNGFPRKGALRGATPAPKTLCVVGALAALALLCVHTLTEISLGVEGEQTKVSAWALLSWTGAAFVEELVFRGYIVVENRGRAALVASIAAFSIVFALAHPFVWDYTIPEGAGVFDGVWKFDFSVQPLISTLAIFECSLLFYVLRFVPQNASRSLLPCVAAHFSYNLGVFAVKAFSGFVG